MSTNFALVLHGVLSSVSFANYQGSTVLGGYEYAFFDEGIDYVEFCEGLIKCNNWATGGQLATAKTAQINSELQSLIQSAPDGAWIGGHDIYSEGYWMWIDDSIMTWTNWSPNEPNSKEGNEDCLALHSLNGYWFDDTCTDDYRGYLCQFPLSAVRAFDFSTLTVHQQYTDFTSAEELCRTMGSTIVQIGGEQEKQLLKKKLDRNRDFVHGGLEKGFWVGGKSEGSCFVVGMGGIEEKDCSELAHGVICETARPHMVNVSNEHPVVTESEYIRIGCSASGYPVPQVMWYKDDQPVSNQITEYGSATLVIENALPSDAGRYACVATNVIYGNQMTSKGVSFVTVLQGQS